ncbi:hypothetical protein BGZ58_001948 [Dissophora ornata]|nr:hypothetical protein BGZ58_001948 [Dissophora ornata]
MLVSLTAPKEGAKDFSGPFHYLGGRFISRRMEDKWELNLPEFPGTDQCVRLDSGSASSSDTTSDAKKKKEIGNKMDRHFLDNVVSQSFA